MSAKLNMFLDYYIALHSEFNFISFGVKIDIDNQPDT